MSETAENTIDLIELATSFVGGKFDEDTEANKLSVRQLRLRMSPVNWNQLVARKMAADEEHKQKEGPRTIREDEVKGGAVVALVCGGPGMTVDYIHPNKQIQCLWFDGRELKIGIFERTSLLLVKPAPADTID